MADRFALEARSFGKIAVATPGSPVRLTTDETLRAIRLRFATLIDEKGRMFPVVARMNQASSVGVLRESWPTGGRRWVAEERVIEWASYCRTDPRFPVCSSGLVCLSVVRCARAAQPRAPEGRSR